MVSWSELPNDLIVLIAKRVPSYEDYVSFGEVCTSWCSAATKHSYTGKLPQIPWLMVPGEEDESENDGLHKFFSLSKGPIHKGMLPEARKECCLSSQGWLLTSEIHNKLYVVHLLHPLSGVEIRLPSLETLPNHCYYATYNLHYITKAVLSSSPSLTSDYFVMLTWGCLKYLAFCRPGDRYWTVIDRWGAQIYDITYFQGRLYGVDAVGSVFECDINGPNPTKVTLALDMSGMLGRQIERFYILELQGKLLMVLRRGEGKGTCSASVFQAFELNLIDGTWFEVKDIRNMAIFLGSNSSFSVQASDANGCKANHIYYTHDVFDTLASKQPIREAANMGIYNLLDRSIESYFEGKYFSRYASAMWVEPSFGLKGDRFLDSCRFQF